jgi:hypothetical protein
LRRPMVLLIAVFMIAIVPATAMAQGEIEFEAELGDLSDAVAGLDFETVEEWEEGLGAVTDAADALKAAAGDSLDFAEFDAAVVALEGAIEGGDVAEIEAAAAEVVAAADALAAQAAEGAEDGDDTPAPTQVATGGAVDDSPSSVLLAVAAVLAMVSGGAFALRRVADRA